MAKNGKKPNARQCNLLRSYHRDPKDWFYVCQEVDGDDGLKRLSKEEDKIIRWVFRHRTTGQEISLEVES